MLFYRHHKWKSFYKDTYRGIDCEGCAKRSVCTKSPKGRMVKRRNDQEWVDNYKKKMKTPRAKYELSKRKGMIEHCFGTIKIWMGKIPLLLRGKEKVTTEIDIYVTAYNLRRLLNIESFDEIAAKIEGYSWEIA